MHDCSCMCTVYVLSSALGGRIVLTVQVAVRDELSADVSMLRITYGLMFGSLVVCMFLMEKVIL